MTHEHALKAQLIDDGTLDTVIRCTSCDWVGRYSHDSDIAQLREEGQHGDALHFAAEDHDHDTQN